MKSLLRIDASLFSGQGNSSRLAQSFTDAWRERNPEGKVVIRDLAADPVPHLTAERFQAFLTQPEERTEEQREIVAYSDALIAELRQADALVLGLPMYNFGIPSTLKSYFDHIARAGVTFRYTAEGPVGLLENKPVYVLAARGGVYQGTPKDTETGFVRDILSLLGLTDIHFIYAEGLNMGPERLQAAFEEAEARISRLAA